MAKSGPLIIALCALAWLLVSSSSVLAQQPLLERFPEGPRPGIPERDINPQAPSVPATHGFVRPLTKKTETGQAGVAGWTIPNVPVGPRVLADPNNAGSLGFGFAAEWGGAPGRARN